MRKKRGRAPRRKKGDKSKNGKQVMMVVTYTLKREGELLLLLGPLNRRVCASFGKKCHAFEYALKEAERRGFGTPLGSEATTNRRTGRGKPCPAADKYTGETTKCWSGGLTEADLHPIHKAHLAARGASY